MTAEEFQRVTDVTYLGQVPRHAGGAAPHEGVGPGPSCMSARARAYRSIPLQSAYCAAKAAVRGFVDSLRTELLHHRSRIRLTMVQLPAVNTPQFDWARSRLPRKLEPVPPIFHRGDRRGDRACRPHAPRELWIGTPSWLAIFGAQAAPALTDHYLARHGYRAR